MDSKYKIFIERSLNELNLAKIIFFISENNNIQSSFPVTKTDTYFSAVISHSYYSIFYAAKSYLINKGIEISAPEEHKKTYNELKELSVKGIIDNELLRIYEDVLIQANSLLKIFKIEKAKRGDFTYKTLNQANVEPAKQSLINAEIFFKHMNLLVN